MLHESHSAFVWAYEEDQCNGDRRITDFQEKSAFRHQGAELAEQ